MQEKEKHHFTFCKRREASRHDRSGRCYKRGQSSNVIKELQNMGIRVVMLTGDNERTAKAIGAQAGVDDVIAGVLPDGKESVIRSLKEQGKVAMVGDGINDAPALPGQTSVLRSVQEQMLPLMPQMWY